MTPLATAAMKFVGLPAYGHVASMDLVLVEREKELFEELLEHGSDAVQLQQRLMEVRGLRALLKKPGGAA